jgi:hypothetical protein
VEGGGWRREEEEVEKKEAYPCFLPEKDGAICSSVVEDVYRATIAAPTRRDINRETYVTGYYTEISILGLEVYMPRRDGRSLSYMSACALAGASVCGFAYGNSLVSLSGDFASVTAERALLASTKNKRSSAPGINLIPVTTAACTTKFDRRLSLSNLPYDQQAQQAYQFILHAQRLLLSPFYPRNSSSAPASTRAPYSPSLYTRPYTF